MPLWHYFIPLSPFFPLTFPSFPLLPFPIMLSFTVSSWKGNHGHFLCAVIIAFFLVWAVCLFADVQLFTELLCWAHNITTALSSAIVQGVGSRSVFTKPTDLNESLPDLINISQAEEIPLLLLWLQENTQRWESLFALMINVCTGYKFISTLVLTQRCYDNRTRPQHSLSSTYPFKRKSSLHTWLKCASLPSQRLAASLTWKSVSVFVKRKQNRQRQTSRCCDDMRLH